MILNNAFFHRLLAATFVVTLAACGEGVQQEAPSVAAEPEAPAEAPAAAPASSTLEERLANMYVSEVTDTFNPGMQIGSRFPAIRAMYEGEEILTIDRFIKDRGMIFMANRSVDW